MAEAPQSRGITRYLSRRLLPLAVGFGLCLALVPATVFWTVEHRNIQRHSTLYAEDLAAKFRDFAAEAPALWKYQTYKFLAISEGFHPTLDVTGFRVLDEKGELIYGYEHKEIGIRRSGGLSFTQELRFTLGSAPIFFNNRLVGTIEVIASDASLMATTVLLLGLSATLAMVLGTVAYAFPVRIVNRAEKALLESESKFRSLTEESLVGIYIIQDGVFRYVNPKLASIFGYEAEEMIERKGPRDITLSEDWPRVEEKLRRSLTGEVRSVRYEFRGASKGRKDIHAEAYGSGAVYRGKPAVIGTLLDVTERKRAEQLLAEQSRELAQLALNDELTGLLNRRGFLTLAGQQLRLADRFGKDLHLLFADLDGLKWINDTLGHGEGDLALQETAELLREIFRESDIIARLGGDEFSVLVMGGSEEGEKAITARVVKQLAAHNSRQGRTYPLSVSIGITRYDPSSPCSIEDLLTRGDALMYEQKRKKKGTGETPGSDD